MRESPDGNSRTEIIASPPYNGLLRSKPESYISLANTKPGKIGDLGLAPDVIAKRGWSPDTDCEVDTQIRFVHDGTAVSVEMKVKFSTGRRGFVLSETQFTPSATVLRTLRNYLWGDVEDAPAHNTQ
jgi:hypothetical protein